MLLMLTLMLVVVALVLESDAQLFPRCNYNCQWRHLPSQHSMVVQMLHYFTVTYKPIQYNN